MEDCPLPGGRYSCWIWGFALSTSAIGSLFACAHLPPAGPRAAGHVDVGLVGQAPAHGPCKHRSRAFTRGRSQDGRTTATSWLDAEGAAQARAALANASCSAAAASIALMRDLQDQRSHPWP